MRLGRPTPPLTLSDDERETLGQWARRSKTAQALAQRARMVVECSKLDFVHSGGIAQRFYEAVNHRAREFSDVGLSRRYAENV